MVILKQGDCMELMKDIPDKSVDLIITDPPYKFDNSKGAGAFGERKKQYRRELKEAEIVDGFDVEILNEFVRVLKKINIYIWCNKKQLRMYIDFFEDLGCNTDLLTWHKTNPVPACNNKYLSDTEYLLFFRETGVKVNGNYNTKKKYYVTPTNKKDKELYKHPTVKPLNITENIVLNSSNEGETVLDVFMGSGTTGVACVNTNRNFIGFELDEHYFETAKNRIDNAKNQNAN